MRTAGGEIAAAVGNARPSHSRRKGGGWAAVQRDGQRRGADYLSSFLRQARPTTRGRCRQRQKGACVDKQNCRIEFAAWQSPALSTEEESERSRELLTLTSRHMCSTTTLCLCPTSVLPRPLAAAVASGGSEAAYGIHHGLLVVGRSSCSESCMLCVASASVEEAQDSCQRLTAYMSNGVSYVTVLFCLCFLVPLQRQVRHTARKRCYRAQMSDFVRRGHCSLTMPVQITCPLYIPRFVLRANTETMHCTAGEIMKPCRFGGNRSHSTSRTQSNSGSSRLPISHLDSTGGQCMATVSKSG